MTHPNPPGHTHTHARARVRIHTHSHAHTHARAQLTGEHTPPFAYNYSFGSATVDNATGVVYVTGTLGYVRTW